MYLSIYIISCIYKYLITSSADEFSSLVRILSIYESCSFQLIIYNNYYYNYIIKTNYAINLSLLNSLMSDEDSFTYRETGIYNTLYLYCV